jgi:hypothetical protein
METIYDSMSGGWFSKEIVGPFGVGVWKYVRREWGVFSRFVRYEVGDGSTIKFSHDLWCGDEPLKVTFSELFSIATMSEGVGGRSCAVL